MQPINETNCPACGKLIALFEKPENPQRVAAACSCGGRLREVIEMDNPNYLSERDILEPAEPVTNPIVSEAQPLRSRRKNK
jgi:hypothetical protein